MNNETLNLLLRLEQHFKEQAFLDNEEECLLEKIQKLLKR